MTSQLIPPFESDSDLLYELGQSGTDIVVFIDYAARPVRSMRDLLDGSAARFKELDVSLAYRLVPSGGPDSAATRAARAAVAAELQGEFAAMHDALFASGPEFSESRLLGIAAQLNLDIGRFRSDMYSSATDKRLDDHRKSADASSDTPYMPMLFINGVHYIDSWDESAIYEAVRGALGSRLSLASSRFISWAASASLTLLIAMVTALVLANSGGADGYHDIRDIAILFAFGSELRLEMTLEGVVTDGLMALFFLIVGIEIKREFTSGELADRSRAALPIFAAVGGMVAPALVYSAINMGGDGARGWGVPIATDIAFALGILALLGDRVPASLKVFVSALAIADDIGAIVVIAVFYGHGFDIAMAGFAVGVYAVMLLLNLGRVYLKSPYIILGIVLWFFIYQSGIHATLAGVLTAFAIPSRPSAQTIAVVAQANSILAHELRSSRATVSNTAVLRLQRTIDRLRDPGFHVQHALENWSSYLVLPLFAFVSMGVSVAGTSMNGLSDEVLGTVLGLALGKPLGICMAVYVAVKTGIGRLSADISALQVAGAGSLAGIGFTMSIFIASAAFEGSQLQAVKAAVLVGSVVSAMVGVSLLLVASRANGASTEGAP